MRYLVIIGIAVIAGILIRIKTKYRMHILAAFAVLMILMNGLYNVKLLGKLLPFYRPTNQTFYQTQFLENGEYPDSLLMLLLKDRDVYIKDDPAKNTHNRYWLYKYYHFYNAKWFLENTGASVICDGSMNEAMVDKTTIENDFEEFGIINDMYRNCFKYNDIEKEWGNYFYYYWYYFEYQDTIRAYLNTKEDPNGETVFDANELVILWDDVEEEEYEDIYIMTKAYYEAEVAESE